MRPEKFDILMTTAIENWLNGDRALLLSLRSRMDRAYSKCLREETYPDSPADARSGHETYGYENTESVQGNMFYISDRWRCAFRLRWVMDGIDEGYI